MSDYGRIKKDGTFKNILVTAPNTYQKSDSEIITNFNEDEALMKEYGYKPIVTTEPPYDENYERLTVESLTQDDENIYLTYGVDQFANPPTSVDLSNYYTKQEVYNKKEIDNMLANLKSESITTEDLYAVNAEIENLKVDFAKIDMAEIDRLSTAYADIEELKSKLANIDTAVIKNLTTEVGNIKLLLNGHLTSDNIQSLVLTSSKVTVEDAFIKDAMIDSVNANKINTGVLNTNKVNIQSEDGSMILRGNLQQFKDSNNKVRIQIGKDATGNFTFSLFNAEGTGVLIDENGIKSGAIGSGLIVDDMVSDNAHISGGKIDIDSLITNINGNESTINSSKIKFDDTNQTLDVAFGSLKTKVDSIEKITVDGDLSSVIKQVQSNTTNIKLQQGQISSLISNTTITTENGKTIQLKDAYNSTVSTVDSLVNKIGKLETNVSSSLTKSETQYYVSTSSTSLEGGEWITDTSPTWTTGKYVWQRMKYTYSNGGIKYSTPVCIQGAKGEDGQDGQDGTGIRILGKYPTLEALKKAHPTGNVGDCYTVNGVLYVWSVAQNDWIDAGGIKGEKGDKGDTGSKGDTGQSMVGSTPQWYASDSAITQTGGTWLDTMPTIEVGKYYWIRYKQTWNNPVKTTYTDPILEELGEAVKEVKSQQSNLEHTLEGFKQTVSNDYAKQTTVTDLTNNLAKNYTTTTDMNSIIDQKVTGVLTTVSKTYATTTSVTDLNTKLQKDYYTSTQVNSAINQKADGILSTVSDSYAEKTVVNDLANNLSSNYTTTTNMNSAIEQKANGILSTVSKTYTTKDELKELSFGGRNYLLDTKNAKTITGTNTANQCTNLYTFSNAKSACNNEQMTLSFTYKVSNYTAGGDFIIQTYGGSSKGWSRIAPTGNGTFTYKHTITTPTNFDTATGVQIRMDAFVGRIEISNMMLEKGNTVSDWTPAPEDNASLTEDLGDYVLNITKETVIVSTDLNGNILS